MSFNPIIQLVRPCKPIDPRDQDSIQMNVVYRVIEKSGCHLKIAPISTLLKESPILVNINDFAPYRYPSVDNPQGFVDGAKVMAVQDITDHGANIKRGDMFTIRSIVVEDNDYMGEYKTYYSGLYLEGEGVFQEHCFMIEDFMLLDIDRMIAI